MNKSNLLSEVVKIAKRAAKMIEHSKDHAKFHMKSDNSYVSEVDINVENYISLALKSLDHSIPVFGEERGAQNMLKHDTFWLIDPIDGTVWYRMGIPIYGSLICLVENGEAILGCISLPGLNQFCYAMKGQGCFFENNGSVSNKIHVNESNHSLQEAIISASGIHGSSIWLEKGTHPWRLENVVKKARTFKLTGDCIQHVQVARGNIDAAIDTIMKPWDSAAVIICIREAGGVVMDLEGNQTNLLKSSSLISAASLTLAQKIVKELSFQ